MGRYLFRSAATALYLSFSSELRAGVGPMQDGVWVLLCTAVGPRQLEFHLAVELWGVAGAKYGWQVGSLTHSVSFFVDETRSSGKGWEVQLRWSDLRQV